MKLIELSACFLIAALVLSACGAESEPAGGAAGTATDAAATDPLSGTWTGTWGPTPDHRNPVTLELTWDGTGLGGTVNPGPDAIEIGNTSFDAATGTVRMEADAENFRGEGVHYMIEGRVAGNTMSGSWTHPGQDGDFTITRE